MRDIGVLGILRVSLAPSGGYRDKLSDKKLSAGSESNDVSERTRDLVTVDQAELDLRLSSTYKKNGCD